MKTVDDILFVRCMKLSGLKDRWPVITSMLDVEEGRERERERGEGGREGDRGRKTQIDI